VREALFGHLGERFVGQRVLDLFAGTGALGLEALSRGASHVTFVETDRGLCQTIETNVEALELGDRVTLERRDVRRAMKRLQGPFDLVFIDPPYGLLLEREALVALSRPGLLAPGALVVVEHASREPCALPAAASALQSAGTRSYGDTSVTFFNAPGEPRSTMEEQHGQAPAASMPQGASTRRVAVYAGSFDPPTNGHIDVIRRASRLFDGLIVAVAKNVRKNGLFSVEERIGLLREVLQGDPRIEIDQIDGLLVEYARRKGAVAVIRGLRAVADFEYEFQMACMNHHLAEVVETVFLMTAQEYFYVSSSLVKEVSALGGDVAPFVPPAVLAKLRARAGRGV
jgi:pantetheine-phosphate adenylyltransferase